VKNFRNDPDSLFPFELSLDVAQGGRASVKGVLNAFKPSAEIHLDIESVALPPLQPYLDRVAKLSLDSGNLSLNGDLRYGIIGPEEKTFKGVAAMNQFLLTLPQTNEPFLSWKSLSANGIDFSMNPRGILIGEALIQEPSGKLVIKEDQTVNIRDVMVSGEKSKEEETEKEEFPFEIKRVRIENGKLDFADLSLTPRFAAKIHDLDGAVAGIASNLESRTSIELEGRVDAYGSVKIEGELQPFDAKSYSDVTMNFRNVDMTNLTPYTATFAGRKIDSGKLSLDLDYKIDNMQLRGENQIVLDRFVLGERVEGPKVRELPLDLAVALLKDTNDRIDIGLPVSGNLDDPDFSYGHLIWKALGNLITKIVTAPFRALGALLGTDEKALDTIAHDAGDSRLPPPEAEKLVTVAKALQQRPQLALQVQGHYRSEVDEPVLKTLAMKHRLAVHMGLVVTPHHDPGPLSFTDPSTQQAIDILAGERLSTEILAELKREFGMPSPEQTKAEPPPAAEKPKAPPPKPDAAGFYREVFKHLVKNEPVDERVLHDLAQKRANAIVRNLTTTGGVDAARIGVLEPIEAEDATGQKVISKLKLVVREKSG
jgi:hypothetical protein